jgi:hypothetical protein
MVIGESAQPAAIQAEAAARLAKRKYDQERYQKKLQQKEKDQQEHKRQEGQAPPRRPSLPYFRNAAPAEKVSAILNEFPNRKARLAALQAVAAGEPLPQLEPPRQWSDAHKRRHAHISQAMKSGMSLKEANESWRSQPEVQQRRQLEADRKAAAQQAKEEKARRKAVFALQRQARQARKKAALLSKQAKCSSSSGSDSDCSEQLTPYSSGAEDSGQR